MTVRSSSLVALAVLVAGLVASVPAATPAAAATFPTVHVLDDGPVDGFSVETTDDGLWTVFQRPGSTGLYSVPTSGGRVRTLETVPVQFRLSPAGTYVVSWDLAQLRSHPVAGGPAVVLADVTGAVVDQVAVSPDGGSVLFRSDLGTPGQINLYRVAIGGGPLTRLNAPLVPTGSVERFEVSHDGTTVAYRGEHVAPGRSELYTVPVTGGAATLRNAPLVAGGSVQNDFGWAPDDSWLVYSANGDDAARYDAYSVDPATGVVRLLTADPSGYSVASWVFSADSATVVFRLGGAAAGASKLLRSDRTAADRLVLATAPAGETIFDPKAVSATGRVLFDVYDGAVIRWESVRLDGTDRRTLSGRSSSGSLTLDGRTLVYTEWTGVRYEARARALDGSGAPVTILDPVDTVVGAADDGVTAVLRTPSGEPVSARLDGTSATLVFGPLPPTAETTGMVATADGRHVVVVQDRFTDGTPALLSAGPAYDAGDTMAFTPLTPARILDTRLDQQVGYSGPKPVAADTVRLKVLGRGGVPDTPDVRAVVLNVTATEASAAGYVTVWPAAATRPLASSLNLERAGQTRPNLVTVAVGAGGSVDLFTQSGTHLVADVAGYYSGAGSASAGRFFPVPPGRVLDSRTGAAPGAGATVTLPVSGRAGLPAAGISAVVLNVTATEAAAAGFVTVWPSGVARPLASNLNLERPGQTVPNQVIVPVGADGAVQLYTQSGTHLVADVAGWFTDGTEGFGTSGLFRAFSPVRMLDTRPASQQKWTGPQPGVGTVVPVTFALPGEGVIAMTVNVTLTEAAGPGYVTAWPSGRPRPLASSLNADAAGQTIPNHVTVAVGRVDQSVLLFTQRGGHLIADVTGTYLA